MINEDCEDDTFSRAQSKSKSITNLLKNSKTNKSGGASLLTYAKPSAFNRMMPEGLVPVNEWVDFSSNVPKSLACDDEKEAESKSKNLLKLTPSEYQDFKRRFWMSEEEIADFNPNFEKYDSYFLHLIIMQIYQVYDASIST